MRERDIIRLFPQKIRAALEHAEFDMEHLYEIRLRVNAPLILIYKGNEYFLTKEGKLTKQMQGVCQVEAKDLRETMEYVSNYSMYAFEEEIRQGFITIQGGHRVGIAGKTVLDGAKIKSLKYISYINLRLSHQIKGCANQILPYVVNKGNVCHTLIISLGIRTDILDCCPKAEGMMMLIRSMSPEVVAVDELGDYEDIHAIESVIHCGCKLFATVHGSSIEDIKRKPLMQRLVQEKIFERYIILHNKDKAGKVKAVFDERGTCLFDETRRRGTLC